MYSYALKRLTRGRGIFLALFLSVALAATLFSGILQASDAVGVSMLGNALEATDVDIVSSAENRNLTRTSLAEVEEAISGLEHVAWAEHLIRSVELGPGEGMEVSIPGVNTSMPFTIVAMASDSNLVIGIEGLDHIEPGEIYVAAGSVNASLFGEGETVTLTVPTYIPASSVIHVQKRSANYTVGGVVEVDDRLFSIAFGRYVDYLTSLLYGTGVTGRRPLHQLIILSEESFLEWMHSIYEENRRHTRVLIAETVIGLERGALVNPWNPEGSSSMVDVVYERVNALGARFGYVPVNYLGQLLTVIGGVSSQMKTNTLLVAAPVFFTAWYLGVTVSDISLGLRRREIGLLFTRGFTHGQAFYIFLFEAVIISILAGATGILLGAAIIPLVMPGIGIAQIFGSVSPVTFIASLVFSCALAVIAIYKPAKTAVDLDIVDALREYQPEEADSGSWHEPALALFLGLYRVAILVLEVTVEQFRPDVGNFVVFLLYSTWWGVDFILSYIAPILLFWGFSKLFIQYLPWFHIVLGRVAGGLIGDIAIFSTLSSRRNAWRTAAYAFMAALILGYGVSVIGGIASTDDFTDRFTRYGIGADASVWLFDWKDADAIRDMVVGVDGVAAATVEKWFEAESIVGTIPVRIIDPLEWREIAYMERGWIEGEHVFEIMNEASTDVLLGNGAAGVASVEIGMPWLIGLGDKVHTFSVVGLFGRDLGPEGGIQNPTLYIPDTYAIKDKYISQSRILVKLEEGVDFSTVRASIEALDPGVQGVDIAEEIIRSTTGNVFLAGPRRVEELGVYFAALVSSAGIVLIVSTALRSRLKELTVMAIRGFSSRQLAVTLLVEKLGMTLFSIALGLGVGLVMLRGETEIFNAAINLMLEKRVVFPPATQLTLIVVVALLVVSTIIPIILIVRHVSENPIWRTQE
jgi:hypothetical protein